MSLRQILGLVSTGLVVLGLELSTSGVSTILGRLLGGLRAIVGGPPGVVSIPRFLLGVVILGVGTAMAVAVVWVNHELLGVGPPSRTCPDCGGRTRRVKRRRQHKVIARLVDEPIMRRHCDTCDWTGLTLKS